MNLINLPYGQAPRDPEDPLSWYIHPEDLGLSPIQTPSDGFKDSLTTRLIIKRADGRLAVLTDNAQRLRIPGGRPEKNESITSAAIREALEETGWQVKLRTLKDPKEAEPFFVLGEIRPKDKDGRPLRIESRCFIAEAVERKGPPTFEEDEVEKGFQLLWLYPDELRWNLQQMPLTKTSSLYHQARGLVILTAYQNWLNQFGRELAA